MRDLYWLSEAQMRRLAPLLPTDTRGKPRVDDRRVISGIVHVLRLGCPWRHAPRESGPPKALYNRYVRWAINGVWRRIFETLAAAGGPPAGVLLDATYAKAIAAPRAGRLKVGWKPKWGAGASDRAVVWWADHQDLRGGETGRQADRVPPLRWHPVGLSGGEVLIEAVPEGAWVTADRAFNADLFRRAIEARGAVPNIPPKANRRWKSCFSPALYWGRNGIERMFCRLKDFRRVATRCNRLAVTYLAALHVAAIVAFWL
jgi:transposase